MGTVDNNGVYKYTEDDTVNGWAPYMNLGMNSVSNALSDARHRLVYTASSQADANSKLAELKTSGINPTASSPVFFWLTDTSNLWVNNGVTWIRGWDPSMVSSDLSSLMSTETTTGSFKLKADYIQRQGNLVTAELHLTVSPSVSMGTWDSRDVGVVPNAIVPAENVHPQVALPFVNNALLRIDGNKFQVATATPAILGGGYSAILTWKVVS